MTLRHKKTCRNKFTLSSGTLVFRLKEIFLVFRNFFDQWNFSIEDCTFLHCSALELTKVFVQLSLDITFHAIECGVTTCLSYGGVEISNDQYFEIWKLLMLKVTRGPIIRFFFYLRNYCFTFFKIIWTQLLPPPPSPPQFKCSNFS